MGTLKMPNSFDKSTNHDDAPPEERLPPGVHRSVWAAIKEREEQLSIERDNGGKLRRLWRHINVFKN